MLETSPETSSIEEEHGDGASFQLLAPTGKAADRMPIANDEIIYDSGRASLWARIPCLVPAILCLALLFDLVALAPL